MNYFRRLFTLNRDFRSTGNQLFSESFHGPFWRRYDQMSLLIVFLLSFIACSCILLQCSLYWSGGNRWRWQYICSVRWRTSGIPPPEILYTTRCHWNDKLRRSAEKERHSPTHFLHPSLSPFPTCPGKWSNSRIYGEVGGHGLLESGVPIMGRDGFIEVMM